MLQGYRLQFARYKICVISPCTLTLRFEHVARVARSEGDKNKSCSTMEEAQQATERAGESCSSEAAPCSKTRRAAILVAPLGARREVSDARLVRQLVVPPLAGVVPPA